MRWLIWIMLAATLLLVLGVGGLTNPFTAWNAAPVIIAMAATWWANRHRRGRAPAAACGFAILASGTVLLAHLAWWFDWGGTATGSSTSGLIFVMLPLLAMAAGLAGLAGGAVIGWRWGPARTDDA